MHDLQSSNTPSTVIGLVLAALVLLPAHQMSARIWSDLTVKNTIEAAASLAEEQIPEITSEITKGPNPIKFSEDDLKLLSQDLREKLRTELNQVNQRGKLATEEALMTYAGGYARGFVNQRLMVIAIKYRMNQDIGELSQRLAQSSAAGETKDLQRKVTALQKSLEDARASIASNTSKATALRTQKLILYGVGAIGLSSLLASVALFLKVKSNRNSTRQNPSAIPRRAWYYLQGESTHGPVSQEELVELLRSGSIPEDTQVCVEGMPTWVPASSLADLQEPRSSVERSTSPGSLSALPLLMLAAAALSTACGRYC